MKMAHGREKRTVSRYLFLLSLSQINVAQKIRNVFFIISPLSFRVFSSIHFQGFS